MGSSRVVCHLALLATLTASVAGCSALDDDVPRVAISTDQAPAAIGPYSQARWSGNTLYLSGQIALDPTTGQMVAGGIEAETRQVLTNIQAVLSAADMDMSNVVQSQVFLRDLDDYSTMNAVYAEFFREPYPARAAVQAARIPRDAAVEIMVVAVRQPERSGA